MNKQLAFIRERLAEHFNYVMSHIRTYGELLCINTFSLYVPNAKFNSGSKIGIRTFFKIFPTCIRQKFWQQVSPERTTANTPGQGTLANWKNCQKVYSILCKKLGFLVQLESKVLTGAWNSRQKTLANWQNIPQIWCSHQFYCGIDQHVGHSFDNMLVYILRKEELELTKGWILLLLFNWLIFSCHTSYRAYDEFFVTRWQWFTFTILLLVLLWNNLIHRHFKFSSFISKKPNQFPNAFNYKFVHSNLKIY